MMNEQLLHYIWKHKLYRNKDTKTTDGLPVSILAPGEHNHDAGPDFFNARIKIADTEWAGCVEIHIKSSDWFLHGHDQDKAYNNVILHVVATDDAKAKRNNGTTIPTIVLDYESRLANNYKILAESQKWISCEDYFTRVDPMIRSMWVETLLIQRLQRKSSLVKTMMAQTNNNLDEVFFRMFCRTLGFKTNTQPFEQLSRQISLRMIRAVGDSRQKIEALLFGAAGLLSSPQSDYANTLKKEFDHLARRFNIEPLPASIWKFARMRPVNFPTVRLAQLADILSRNTSFTQQLKSIDELKHIKKIFHANVSPFWETHYTFQKKSKHKPKPLGDAAIDIIIINAVAPFLFVVGQYYGDQKLQHKIFSWLETIPAEKNSIITRWKSTGAAIHSAYESQAYLELYNEYCKEAKCLDCRLGGFIIKEI